MTDKEESAYIQGKRVAWAELIRTALRELGYGPNAFDVSKLVVEREEAISQLRQLCEDFGDNDWEPGLHLADIIEKHLAKRLYEEHGSE